MKIRIGKKSKQIIGWKHSECTATYYEADKALIQQAIDGALAAKASWELMPFNDRAAIFLKAADLLSTKYRFELMAATMVGQGKNAWQAEIDAAAELIDFWRFNCQYAQWLYEQQPEKNAPGVWNRMEYRPLEGFVTAITPFNFTAIGGNLVGAPALMGNVVLWKPSAGAIRSNYLVYKILEEAGLPKGVIQFIPSCPNDFVDVTFGHKEFAGLHFTGSTQVFKDLWKKIAANLDIYKSYPRIVGETGGKNMHFVHSSADVDNVVNQTIRAAFEYQGQKCSACSRIYVPDNLWSEIKEKLLMEHKKLKVGPPTDFKNHVGAVIHKGSFEKIKSYIDFCKSADDAKVIAGGKCFQFSHFR